MKFLYQNDGEISKEVIKHTDVNSSHYNVQVVLLRSRNRGDLR